MTRDSERAVDDTPPPENPYANLRFYGFPSLVDLVTGHMRGPQ